MSDNFDEPYMANRMWEIAEFEIYGEGYVPRGLYLSKALELDAVIQSGRKSAFFGFKDRDAKLRIRTRSGSDEDPERYWRLTGRGDEKSFLKANGQPLTLSDYNSLQGGKGGITTDLDKLELSGRGPTISPIVWGPQSPPRVRGNSSNCSSSSCPKVWTEPEWILLSFHITQTAGGWSA